MTRAERYPDTATFRLYNANPHGRIVGDCVARSLCTALGRPWEDVIKDLTEYGTARGLMANDKACYTSWLELNGWTKHKQPRKKNGKKYTGAEFCRKFKPTCAIAHIGGNHIVAIIDGKVHDTWDSTSGCIGNYWTLE